VGEEHLNNLPEIFFKHFIVVTRSGVAHLLHHIA